MSRAWAPAVVIAAALAPRLLLFAVFAPSPELFAAPDSDLYARLARTLLAVGRFAAAPDAPHETFRTPGYPCLLAAVFGVAGESRHAVIALQIAISTLTAAGVYALGRRLAGDGAGLWAGLSIALSPWQIYHANLLLSETLAGALLLAAVLCAAAGARGALGAGLLLGASVLVRPFGVFFIVICLVWLLLRDSSPLPRRLVPLGWMTLGYALPVVGWMTVNAAASGHFALTTIGGYNLLEARAGGVRIAVYRETHEQALRALYTELDRRGAGQEWSAAEREAAARALALEVIAAHPAAFAYSAAKSVAQLYNGVNADLYQRLVFRATEPAELVPRRWVFGLWAGAHLAALGMVYALAGRGLLRLWRARDWATWWLLSAASVYPAVLLLGAATAYARYRVPFEPFIALLAALGAPQTNRSAAVSR